MAKDPAFLFYPNDWIGGTMGMSFAEKGAYMEVLMMQFNRGHMTTDMIGHAIGQFWDMIKHKFEQDEKGLWFNERLEQEILKRKKYVNSRTNNKLGVNQHTKNESVVAHKKGHNIGHMTIDKTLHMENENENTVFSKKEEVVTISKNAEKKNIKFLIVGVGDIEINTIDNCEDWQMENMIDFLTKSQREFETIAMNKPLLRKNNYFNMALQKFINNIQESGQYSTVSEMKRYFRNFLNDKNGSLEEYLIGKKDDKQQQKTQPKINI